MSLDEAFARVVSEKEARLFRPSAGQIASATREYGYLEIIAFPSIDALIASAVAIRALRGSRVEFSLRLEPVAPRELAEPSLLIGYPAAVAQELSARKPSALIGYGDVPQGILPVAVTAARDSSVAALTVGVFSEITIVGGFSAYALAAGYWRGLDRGKRGEFTGVEASIAEMLKLENKVEEYFTIRLMRWLTEPTEKAIALTVVPFLPGLTGRSEEAEKLLAGDPRLTGLRGKTLEEAEEQALAVLGEKLYELLKQKSRVPRRPTEVIGFTHYSRSLPLPDLREAAAILACTAAERPEALPALGVSEKGAAAAAHYRYRRAFPDLVAAAEELVEARPRHTPLGKLLVAELEPGKPGCPPLLEKTARQLGAAKPEAVAAVNNRVLLESVAEAAGYEALKALIEKGCLVPEEGGIYAAVEKTRC